MLGAVSRVAGVQSYSDSSKKSSSLDVIDALTRANVRVSVVENDWAALTRIVPPRCEDLRGHRVSNEKPCRGSKQEEEASAPDVGQRPLEVGTCDLEVLQIADELRDLGEIGRSLRTLCNALANVRAEKAV